MGRTYYYGHVEETGLWCPECQVPTITTYRRVVLKDEGVTMLPGLVALCIRCRKRGEVPAK